MANLATPVRHASMGSQGRLGRLCQFVSMPLSGGKPGAYCATDMIVRSVL